MILRRNNKQVYNFSFFDNGLYLQNPLNSVINPVQLPGCFVFNFQSSEAKTTSNIKTLKFFSFLQKITIIWHLPAQTVGPRLRDTAFSLSFVSTTDAKYCQTAIYTSVVSTWSVKADANLRVTAWKVTLTKRPAPKYVNKKLLDFNF